MQLLLGLVLLADHVSTFEWHIRTYVHNHMLMFLCTLQLEALATPRDIKCGFGWSLQFCRQHREISLGCGDLTSWSDTLWHASIATLGLRVPAGKVAMQQVKFPWAMHRRDIRGLKIGFILVAGCNSAKRLKRNVAMMLRGAQCNFPALTSVGLNKCDNNRSSRLPPIAWPCLLVTCDYPVNT